jgi:hypothetical protein
MIVYIVSLHLKGGFLMATSSKDKNNQSKVEQVNPKNKVSSTSNGLKTSAVKVPRKEVVVSSDKKPQKEDRHLKEELKKQKQQSDKQKKLQEKKQEQEATQAQKQQNRAAKKEKKEQQRLEKQQQTEAKKVQKQKQAEEKKQQKKDSKNENKPKSKSNESIKQDYALGSLTELENKVLRRKETEEERKKRVLIIILSSLLVVMIIIGSFTVSEIIDDRKPQPIEVKIVIETEMERTPIDPNNPELGYVTEIVYPGDTIDIGFYVYNTVVTSPTPVFIRFRAYIALEEEATEHSVFQLHFIDEPLWFSLLDEQGHDLELDDWYYYGGLLPVGEDYKIQIINALTIRTDLENEFQGKDFTIILQIEAIEGSEEAATEIFEEWWLAPEEWYEHMEANDWYINLIPQEPATEE